MAKVALLIGVSDYQISGSDQGFIDLPSAKLDVEGMKRILEDPERGAFDQVKPLVNPLHYEMSQEIESFLGDRQKEDLVLLYFSGHGVKDGSRKLYFAAKGTRKKYQGRDEVLTSTGVSAQYVRDLLADCKATKKIMILDCCFSGAIDPNAKGDDTLEVLETALSAVRGSIILTSSSSTEISYGDPTQMSFYTRYFVHGVVSGEADRDANGHLSIKELHSYVRAKLLEERREMTPQNIFIKEDGFFDAPLIRVPIANPAQAYRKKVEAYIKEGYAENGTFDQYIQDVLEGDRNQINRLTKIPLLPNDATAIEVELLQPIKQRLANLEKYRNDFRRHLENQTLEQSRKSLKLWRERVLKLTDADVAEIEQEEQQRLTSRTARAKTVAPPVTPAPTPTPVKPSLPTSTFEFQVATLQKKTGTQNGYSIARTQKRTEFFTEKLSDTVSLDMVAIPAGSFQMGSTEASDEQPVHQVTIAPFFFGKYPVTQAQWQVVAGFPKVNHNLEPDPAKFKGNDRPVEQVSWWQAVEFCDRLSRKTNRTYRLPSEAEWEYACRAGTKTPFHFGETIATDLANYRGTDWEINGTVYPGNYGQGSKGIFRKETTSVGSFGVANAFGLYDMHGNVWEWCADHWHENYQGAPIDGSAWLTDNREAKRLMRGGSWGNYPVVCRSAYRDYYDPGYRYDNLGFRVVCVFA